MINEEIKHNNELDMEEQEAMDILINIKIGYDKSRLGFAEYQLNTLISEYERLKEIRDDIQSKFFLLFDTLNEYQISNDTIDIFEEASIMQRSKEDDDYLDDFEFEDDTVDNMIEEELNRNYEEETESSYINELNDSDLFNLIDSMYEREDNE